MTARYIVVDGRWYDRYEIGERFCANPSHGHISTWSNIDLFPTGEVATRDDGAIGEVFEPCYCDRPLRRDCRVHRTLNRQGDWIVTFVGGEADGERRVFPGSNELPTTFRIPVYDGGPPTIYRADSMTVPPREVSYHYETYGLNFSPERGWVYMHNYPGRSFQSLRRLRLAHEYESLRRRQAVDRVARRSVLEEMVERRSVAPPQSPSPASLLRSRYCEDGHDGVYWTGGTECWVCGKPGIEKEQPYCDDGRSPIPFGWGRRITPEDERPDLSEGEWTDVGYTDEEGVNTHE